MAKNWKNSNDFKNLPNNGIMGIDHSQPKSQDIDVDEREREVCDYWSHHAGTICQSEHEIDVSVFVGESAASRNTFWAREVPLEKNAKNLMVYRHPCIIKYISFWKKATKFHLAVEDVSPLSQALPSLTDLQISIGLYSILKALCFLHETAQVSHNNICISSIYVTKDGDWKLGAMEYLCKYTELNSEYLNKSRAYRYSKAVDPNEDKLLQYERKDLIDVYGFGVFAREVLKSKQSDDESLAEFCNYCDKELQNTDAMKRPTFRDILNHPFFDQDFIKIHSFLIELPLKVDSEKTEFFKTLVDKLRTFEERLVANQLSSLLVSRMVLLNSAAQQELLPLLLSPRDEDTGEDNAVLPLFGEETFRMFLCPKLLDIFKVHDVQIRLLLLNHFQNFLHMFTRQELQLHILPELLVGIKDTNDELVAATLRSLADLVSVLGSDVVIGGKRARLFNDGKPTQPYKPKPRDSYNSSKSSISQDSTVNIFVNNHYIEHRLPERPRPDGGEETSTEDIGPSADEDLETWDDWDTTENNVAVIKLSAIMEVSESAQMGENPQQPVDDSKLHQSVLRPAETKTNINNLGIQELDIKSQVDVEANKTEEIDFFQDMEPVITQSNKYVVQETESESTEKTETETEVVSSKFNMASDGGEEGWEDNGWD